VKLNSKDKELLHHFLGSAELDEIVDDQAKLRDFVVHLCGVDRPVLYGVILLVAQLDEFIDFYRIQNPEYLPMLEELSAQIGKGKMGNMIN
jgi:hypothetical protein